MRILFLLTVIVLLMSSCRDREDEIFTLEMEARLNIPGGLDNIVTHVFVIEDLPSTLEAFGLQNGYTLDDIARVNPATARFTGLFEQYNYNFIDRIAINITKANDNGISREIFYQELIELNHSGDLRLFGTLTDIKPFLVEDAFDLEVEIRFRQPTTQFLENRLLFSFVAYDNE